ncbi:MAG: AAA family ATPase [Leptolyngbyaceae cyanobacterium SM1_4_3]|nr:AAA family ATPase [Leptolyngbyaceae cyanobacterium SM1_4_3]
MRIKRLVVDGFRSLVDFEITFDESLTIIVGENDSGKTSLIDCLKVITQGRLVTLDDLTYGKDQLTISVEIDDSTFKRVYKRNNNSIDEVSFDELPTEAFLTGVQTRLKSNQTNEQDKDYILEMGRRFGLTVKANSNLDNLKKGILEKIENCPGNLVIEKTKFPRFNNIQLDGRQFENISDFFKEVFLKEKQSSIWQERIDEDSTIEDFCKKSHK